MSIVKARSTVFVKFGVVFTILSLTALSAIRIGHLYQLLERDRDADQALAADQGIGTTALRHSEVLGAPIASLVSPSHLAPGTTSIVRIQGERLSGALVSGSTGLHITQVQIELDTLILRVVVDQGAMPGAASLTLVTGSDAITVPITIAPRPRHGMVSSATASPPPRQDSCVVLQRPPRPASGLSEKRVPSRSAVSGWSSVPSAGFAGRNLSWGEVWKGGEAPLRAS
ncbi:MAG: hypothetical protein C5B48_00080 [Candidatus Rokuibacteriota bacterium]|nr:MAG: hypothetical protein C5B48_00080 [Candidatus Rokubacteria bacterium]